MKKKILICIGAIAAVFVIMLAGLYTWHKISPYTYLEYINFPIVEWHINNLRSELITCNKKYGADKYLLADLPSNKPGLLIRWRPESKVFLPEFYHLGFSLYPDEFTRNCPPLDPEEKNKILSCIQDISPLKGMKLYSLSLSDTAVNDLEPLRGMPLRNLSLPDNLYDNSLKKVNDFSVLKGMKLWSISISNCEIKDLSFLRGMPLKYVFLTKLPITSLEPLQTSPLEILDCREVPIKDLSPISETPLTFLLLDHTKISDISPLAKIKTLKRISISGTKITDLTPLFGTGIKIHLYIKDGPNKGHKNGTPEEIQKYLDAAKKQIGYFGCHVIVLKTHAKCIFTGRDGSP